MIIVNLANFIFKTLSQESKIKNISFKSVKLMSVLFSLVLPEIFARLCYRGIIGEFLNKKGRILQN